MIQLLQWCHRKSKQFEKSSISPAEFFIPNTSSTYRGVCTLKFIRSGSQVLFMPEKVLITSSCFPEPLQLSEDLSLHEKFAIFVLLLMKKKHVEDVASTEYLPYLDSLPKDFAGYHPGYLKNDEMKSLPNWLASILSNQQELITLGYEKSVNFLTCHMEFSDYHITFEEYRWAWYVVNTRSVLFVRKENDTCSKEMALAPFLDLFNHAPEPNTEVIYEQGKGYTILCKSDIPPKQQIFISYGPHPNYKLWSEYGFFSFQPNPFNCVPFDLKFFLTNKSDRNKWLHNLLNDKRKQSVIQELNLLEELSLLENELSPNFQLLIALSLWDPEKERFNYHVDKLCSEFLEIVRDVIKHEKKTLEESLELLNNFDHSVITASCQFLHACITLCDNLGDFYDISSR